MHIADSDLLVPPHLPYLSESVVFFLGGTILYIYIYSQHRTQLVSLQLLDAD